MTHDAVATETSPGATWRLIRAGFGAQAAFFYFAVAYAVLFQVFVLLVPEARPSSFGVAALGFFLASVPVMLFSLALTRLPGVIAASPASPIRAIGSDLWSYLSNPHRLANGIPMLAAMVPLVYAYTAFKNNIPVVTTFDWDRPFADLDRVIHFGYEPWVLLDPVFGNLPVIFLLNLNYNAWFLVMWAIVVRFGFSDHASEARTRFFITFMLIWSIGGTILAFQFSSAGPAFFGRLGFEPDVFAPLMDQLRAVDKIVPVWALDVQDMLWAGYLGKGELEGISAMPSMHVATAMLFMLAGFELNRRIGWLLAAHFALILLGSVYLAWHYAVDGYASIALTYFLWRLSAPLARRFSSERVASSPTSRLRAPSTPGRTTTASNRPWVL